MSGATIRDLDADEEAEAATPTSAVAAAAEAVAALSVKDEVRASCCVSVQRWRSSFCLVLFCFGYGGLWLGAVIIGPASSLLACVKRASERG